jgi:hypothetical protein
MFSEIIYYELTIYTETYIDNPEFLKNATNVQTLWRNKLNE